MKKQLTSVAALLSLSVFFWSCNQSDPAPRGDYVNGVFVINEGNFSQNNGAISFFSREANNVQDDIFSKVNGKTLGGGVQGYAFSGDKGVILVDNSAAGLDKIEIVTANTFASLTAIGAPDIENPREVVISNKNKAYVSCWGTNSDYTYKTGYIAVVDLGSNKVIRKIDIPAGPENLVYHNDQLFVGTVSYGGGKNLTVINTNDDLIAKTITLPASATPIGIDANGKLWTGAGLNAVKINVTTYAVESTFPIGIDATKSAGNFALSADLKSILFVLSYSDANYVTHGETYKFGVNDSQVNVTTPLIRRVFSGLSVDPAQGLIYAGVTPSYAQAGYTVRYRADGSRVDSIKVAVAPTGFVFR